MPIENRDFYIRIVALICVTIVTSVALFNGIDSTLLKATFAIIGVIAGVSANTLVKLFKKE